MKFTEYFEAWVDAERELRVVENRVKRANVRDDFDLMCDLSDASEAESKARNELDEYVRGLANGSR